MDRAAASLGVQWESTPLARMNELVQAREWDAAERAVRGHSRGDMERGLRGRGAVGGQRGGVEAVLLARHLEAPPCAHAGHG